MQPNNRQMGNCISTTHRAQHSTKRSGHRDGRAVQRERPIIGHPTGFKHVAHIGPTKISTPSSARVASRNPVGKATSPVQISATSLSVVAPLAQPTSSPFRGGPPEPYSSAVSSRLRSATTGPAASAASQQPSPAVLSFEKQIEEIANEFRRSFCVRAGSAATTTTALSASTSIALQ